MLDPASSVEMVKVLEEDPMVGGVGGDVQVWRLHCTLKVVCIDWEVKVQIVLFIVKLA